MKNLAFCAILSTASLLPFAAFAAPLECPEAAAVFAKSGGSETPISINDLSKQVGHSKGDARILYEIAEELRRDYPKASKAEVSDMLIVGYCHFLNSETPETTRSEAEVIAFENAAYQAAFGNAPPAEYVRKDWLTGN